MYAQSRGKPVVATRYHAMIRFQMEVISTVQRLLAMRSDIAAEMVLIGRLVVGETGIAIETVGAVLHREMGDGVIKRGDAQDGLLDALFEVGADGVVLGLMRLKPLPVIVGRQLAQILQNAFGVHLRDRLKVLSDALPLGEFHLQVFIVEEESGLAYLTFQLPVEPFHHGLGVVAAMFLVIGAAVTVL